MNFYVMTEPELSENFWNTKYMTGMRAAVREYKGRLLEIEPCDLDKIVSLERDGDGRIPVILNGRSPDWIASHIEYVSSKGFHPILLATYNNTAQLGVSSLTFDFYGIYTAWCAYMCKQGWNNIALVGVSPDNMSDVAKCEAFRDYNNRHNIGSNTGIYYMNTSLRECCESFLAESARYDAVLCTNDVVAIVLNSMLKKGEINRPVHIHSFWDSPLAEFIAPEIKMVSLDYHELGRQAIRIYSFLVNNPGLESVSAIVQGVPYIAEENVATSETFVPENAFLHDECAGDVYMLERLFSVLDAIDFNIIGGIACGVPYEQIAEKELISVGTVKYRVKRMLSLAQKSSREELLELIDRYLGTENFSIQ